MEFRDVKGFPRYKVSENGIVVRKSYEKKNPLSKGGSFFCKERVLKSGITDRDRYHRVELSNDNIRCRKSIHSLVAEAFIGDRPDGYQIDHIDGNRNNNHYTNLEYVTPSENMKRATAKGLNKVPKNSGSMPGESNPSAKITEDTAKKIKAAKELGVSAQKTADTYGVKRRLVYAIWSGELWKHI